MTSENLRQDDPQTSAASMFSHSQLHDINEGTFYSIGRDAHIHHNATRESGLDYLRQFMASGALHDAAERFPQPKCHESTRVRILEKIIRWITEDFSTRVLWLRGSAGVGKSAICQTIAEMCKVKPCLAATFFFSRSSLERNTDKHFIATIAYQMALAVPGLKLFVSKAVEEDRSIVTKDINSQILHLIIQPLIQATHEFNLTSRFLVIIDGLDECVDEKEQSRVLSAISDALTKHDIPLCFLVASRPEHQITFRFRKDDLLAITKHLILDEDDGTIQDIEAFLNSEFSRIRHEYSIPDTPQWPKEGTVNDLAYRASGQFIYASTIIKFVDDPRDRPQKRLDVVLGISPSGSLSPFAEIDALYTQILSNVSNVQVTLLCFGLLCEPLCEHYDLFRLEDFDQLLFLESGKAHLIFSDLHSIVDIPAPGREGVIRIRHKSLNDFLGNKLRSGKYFIDKDIIEPQITRLLMAYARDWVATLRLEHFQSVKRQESSLSLELLWWVLGSWVDRLCSIRGEVNKEILDELTGIADVAMKKNFDVAEAWQFGRLHGSDTYTRILSWMKQNELHIANPILYNTYRTLFDKALISRLEPFSSIGPRHSFHVFLLFGLHRNMYGRDLTSMLFSFGYFSNLENFDDFFADPQRSGKFYLNAQDHADIAASYFRYVINSNVDGFCQKLGINKDMACRRIFGLDISNRFFDSLELNTAVAKHLSNASTSDAELIHTLCRCYPNTIPQSSLSTPDQREALNMAMTRYLLKNSQGYERLVVEEKKLAADVKWKRVISISLCVTYFILVAYIFNLREVLWTYKTSQCICA